MTNDLDVKAALDLATETESMGYPHTADCEYIRNWRKPGVTEASCTCTRRRFYELAAHVRLLVAEIERLASRQSVHLEQIRNLSQSVPLESEVAEALSQRGELLAEIGTLRAEVERWRAIGTDMIHGAMLAALGRDHDTLVSESESLRLRAERAEGELERAENSLALQGSRASRAEQAVSLLASVLGEARERIDHRQCVRPASESRPCDCGSSEFEDRIDDALQSCADIAKSALGERAEASEPSDEEVNEVARELYEARDSRGSDTPWVERYHAMARAAIRLGARSRR